MDNNSVHEILSNKDGDAINDVSDYDELVRNHINLYMTGVASAKASTCVWLQLCCAAISLHTSKIVCTPSDREGTQRDIIHNISTSEQHCLDMLRVSTEAFEFIVTILKSKGRVRTYSRSTIEEQLITFLLILGHNFKNRVVIFFLCRSGKTISRYFHNMLVSIITLEDDYVKPPNIEEVQPIILNSHRFYPFFKDCLGAIDGTHVRVKVSQIDAPRYKGRKYWPTQNVLAACTFNLKFTYILAGWEGSASDSRVLQSALTMDEPLLIPEGKYYLDDAGFGLTSKILTPYGRTRYHLKEFSQRPPETPEELFNHRHSSLRNSIERAFGVLKKRFPIIASGSECQYSVKTMTNIILACCVLHNFILSVNDEDQHFTTDGVEGIERGADCQDEDVVSIEQTHGDEYMRGQIIRDRIARDMWEDYCRQREESLVHMATPNRGKSIAPDGVEKSPKNFRWSQSYEDTLIDLLVTEMKKGNRPDSSFTATAFRNVVTDFNRINGTTIMKKHVLNRIKTMKSYFVSFHGAFKGLSGFAWNPHTKMFDAEDNLWEQRIQENPKLKKFREKACHNWDKLYELYGDTRARGDDAICLKDCSNRLKRAISFGDIPFDSESLRTPEFPANEASSFGDHEMSLDDGYPTSTPEYGGKQTTGGSSRSARKKNKKSPLITVMEDGYNSMAASIRELSMTVKGSAEKVAGTKFDVAQNSMILEALSELGLEQEYKVSCYLYLSSNPSKGAVVVAAPIGIRGQLVKGFMDSAGM